MWIRRDLKERAKSVLRKIYWKAFLVSIVIALATGGGSGSSWTDNSDKTSKESFSSIVINADLISKILTIIMISIGIMIVAALLRVLIGFPLEVGGRRYFLKSAQYQDNTGCFRFAFKGESYAGIVLTMLLKAVQNALWYLLFIIPGIIKTYSYRMVPYILADNPNIGYKEAIKLSIKMTDGHKFDMFVLDLSFIGWCILGAIALGVGILFVFPYINATNAELYLVLRKNALDNNFCSYEELLLGRPISA